MKVSGNAKNVSGRLLKYQRATAKISAVLIAKITLIDYTQRDVLLT